MHALQIAVGKTLFVARVGKQRRNKLLCNVLLHDLVEIVLLHLIRVKVQLVRGNLNHLVQISLSRANSDFEVRAFGRLDALIYKDGADLEGVSVYDGAVLELEHGVRHYAQQLVQLTALHPHRVDQGHVGNADTCRSHFAVLHAVVVVHSKLQRTQPFRVEQQEIVELVVKFFDQLFIKNYWQHVNAFCAAAGRDCELGVVHAV